MKRILLIFLLAVVSLAPKCTPSYQKCAQAVDAIAGLNQALQQGAQNARQSGLISPQEDIQLQQIVVKVSQINDKLADAVTKGSSGDKTWIADIDVALALGADLNVNQLLFIKNDTKRQELQVILAGVRSALDLIAQEVGQ